MEGWNKMTREQQIRQASIEYTMENAPKCIGGDAFSEIMDGMNRNRAFEEGAKWADKTIIDKAWSIAYSMYQIGMEKLIPLTKDEFIKAIKE